MNDPTVDDFDDPTLGFRSNLDGTFADAEARMRRRVAAVTATPRDSRSDRPEPAPLGEELPSYVPAERRHRRRGRRTAALGVALATVVLVVGLVWDASRRDTAEVPSVDQMAQAAADSPSEPFSLDQPIELDVVTIEPRGSATVSRRARTTVDVDGTGQVATDAEELLSGDPGTRLDPASTRSLGSEPAVAGFSYPELLDLPSEPAVMTAAIEAVLGTRDQGAVAEVLAWVASARAAAPEVRAAAVTALGELSTSGPTTSVDRLGRPGVALDGATWTVVLDPSDGSASAFRSDAPDGAGGEIWTLWNP